MSDNFTMCYTCGGHGRCDRYVENHVPECSKDDSAFCWSNCYEVENGICDECDGEGGWVDESPVYYRRSRDSDYDY